MPRKPIHPELDKRIRSQARNRCGYCLSPQHLVMARLEIEHIVPVCKGGSDDETNLWLACPICNSHKSSKTHVTDPETTTVVPLYNPRTQIWSEHFLWSNDGLKIVGITPIGRATVRALMLDNDRDAIEVRRYWVIAGWHPPED